MVEGKYVRGPRVRQAAELGAELWPEGGSSVEEEGAGQLGRPGWGLKTPEGLRPCAPRPALAPELHVNSPCHQCPHPPPPPRTVASFFLFWFSPTPPRTALN